MSGDGQVPVIATEDIGGYFTGTTTDVWVPVMTVQTGDKLLVGGTIRNTDPANGLDFRLTFQRYGIDIVDVVGTGITLAAVTTTPLVFIFVGGQNVPVIVGPLLKFLLEVKATVPGSQATYIVEPLVCRAR
jgi:hypothetical protein